MSQLNPSDEWAAKLKVTETADDGTTYTRIILRGTADFAFLKELGEGSYSTVMLAKDKHTEKLYAIKVLDKRHIVKEKKIKYVGIEKDALNHLGKHTGIIHLFFTFQDENSLYYVLDYASNGELLGLIKKYGTLNCEVTKYYCAQILDALKYIHSKGIIHRDLKPENILLDDGWKIQITDFGTAKMLRKDDGKYVDDGKAKSFVGTAEYVSPELLNEKSVGKPCDVWALGCIIYQMIAGRPPFKATNEYLTFQQVMKGLFAFSAGFPTIFRDLVKRMLVLVPEDRATIKELERHLLFNDINWKDSESTVWYSPPPEFSPYKVSAQAMKPMPELGAGPKVRIPIKSRRSSPIVSPKTSISGSIDLALTKSKSVGNGRSAGNRSVSANAAALALTKGPTPVEPLKEKRKNNKTVKKSASTRETRDTRTRPSRINTVSSPKITSPKISSPKVTSPRVSSPKVSSPKVSSPKVASPMSPLAPKKFSPLDLEWYKFLNNSYERIMKVGALYIKFSSTEAFEKKFKGKLANSPLYFKGKRSSNGNINYSLLTQMVRGNGKSGLRGAIGEEESAELGKEDGTGIVHYVRTSDVEEIDAELENATPNLYNNTTANLGRGMFKKLVSGTKSISTSVISGTPTIDFTSSRIVLVTSTGRLLLLGKRPGVSGAVKDNFSKYELMTAIDLTNPSIRIKEVIMEQGGIHRLNSPLSPTSVGPANGNGFMGVFAIMTYSTTTMFQVDKSSLNDWTELITEARLSGQDYKVRKMIENDPPAGSGMLTKTQAALAAANLGWNS